MKRITLFLVLAVLTLASFTSYTLYSRGDVDQDGQVNIGDGSVTVVDAVMALDFVLVPDGANPYEFDAADMNQDGEVTVTDITDIIDIINT